MKQWILSLVAILLAACLLAGCGGGQSAPQSVPDAAPAAPEGQEDIPEEPPEEEPPAEPDFVEAAPGDLLYEYVEELGGVMVYGYTGSAEGISIPAQLDGEPVVQIGDGIGPETLIGEDGWPVLDDDGNLIYPNGDLWPVKRIELPEGVVTIADRAFRHCTELETLLIPDSVTAIGICAFQEASLKSVTIPDSVITIRDCAFMDCASLESVELPGNLSDIADDLFMGCTSLKNIAIPDGVGLISYGAFSGCTALESIVIPESVRWIGEIAFADCTSLRSITVPDTTIIFLGAFRNCEAISFTYRGGSFDGTNCADIVFVDADYLAAQQEATDYQLAKAQG